MKKWHKTLFYGIFTLAMAPFAHFEIIRAIGYFSAGGLLVFALIEWMEDHV